MNASLRSFVWLNVLGGAAVLASYAWGVSALGDDAGRAWGGVPESLRPWYTLSMMSAAAGYFPMTWHVLAGLRRDPGSMRGATALYAGILAFSALWLPLTCRMLEQPSPILWWSIRADLAVVAACSLLVLFRIARSPSAGHASRRLAALGGALAFCLQTVVLDAIVWPAYFSG
jgi:hypothetical protein